MPKHNKNIPLNAMDDNLGQGISIDRIHIKKSDFKTAHYYKEATQSHRDEGYTFHIVEKGTILIEIDFQKYEIKAPSVVYMHPNQVHRILNFSNMTVCSLAIKSEHINRNYLEFLEEITPAKPLALTKETHSIVSAAFSLCSTFSALGRNQLHFPLLKDSCNALVAFLVSKFLDRNRSDNNLSRSETVYRSFRQLLEKNYRTAKRPNAYAKRLNISTPYLNECIRNATGHSVSQHIQDRIILEAKRLLCHTDKSVKEIAFDLGYEDYPYFSRVFTKAAGMSALAFRHQNHDSSNTFSD